MDKRLLEMRRELARKYQAAPSDLKPTAEKCEACGKPKFESKVCPKSGLYHDLHSHRIVGGMMVDESKKQITGKELMEAINAIRVKWQPARLSKVYLDSDSVNIFQSFVRIHRWNLMRCGICYGTYDPKEKSVAVHAIYEPEQIGSPDGFELIQDNREASIDKLAAYIGLQRVGYIVTQQPRDSNEIILTGQELLLLAREQSRFGEHCVMITIAPDPQTNNIEGLCWQASEQCTNLFRLGFLSECKTDLRYITSNRPLEIAQDNTDERGHQKMVIKEPSCLVDTRWMIAPVAVAQYASPLVRNRFARISRPGEAPPTMQGLKQYLYDPSRASQSFVERIADFHVLVFLAENVFSVTEGEMPIIAEAVCRRDNSAVLLYEDLLKECFNTA